MGISDREYVRNERYAPNFGGYGWDIIGWIIAVTIVTYVAQLLIQPYFTDWFSLKTSAVVRGQIWRLVTFDFLHSVNDPWHIIINLYVLYRAGQKLLSNHTQKEFLSFYLLAGVAAGVANVVWQLFRQQDIPTVGASGSVAAVLMLYALYWPRDTWLIFYIIPVPVIVLVLISAALDLHPVLYEIGTGFPRDHIAHMAHLGGMLFALAYYKLQWRFEPFFSDFSFKRVTRLFRRRPKLRVHRPEDESTRDLKSQMDDLLEKISRSGEASLTDDEREALNRISRQLRNRRG